MRKQCVPGSFFTTHAQEPGNKANAGAAPGNQSSFFAIVSAGSTIEDVPMPVHLYIIGCLAVVPYRIAEKFSGD